MVLMEYGDEALVRVRHERQVRLVLLGPSVIQEPQQVSGGPDMRLAMLFDAVALEQHPHHHLLQFRDRLRIKVSVLADPISQYRELKNRCSMIKDGCSGSFFSFITLLRPPLRNDEDDEICENHDWIGRIKAFRC